MKAATFRMMKNCKLGCVKKCHLQPFPRNNARNTNNHKKDSHVSPVKKNLRNKKMKGGDQTNTHQHKCTVSAKEIKKNSAFSYSLFPQKSLF